MKKRRICMMEFMPYEGEAFTQYLNEMADRGWFLTGLKAGLLWFEWGTPGMRRYLAVAMPGASVFDSESDWGTKRFREPYAKAGWKFVCSRMPWQIFVRDPADSSDESQDEAGKLAYLQQLKPLSVSRGKVAMAIVLFALIGWDIVLMFRHPGEAFASNQNLMLAAVLAGCACGYPFQLMTAARWHRRAEQVLAQTGKLPEVSVEHIRRRNRVSHCLLAVAVFVLLMALLESAMGTAGWVIVLLFALMGGIMLAVNSLVLHWVREQGTGDRRESMIGYGVGSVCISFMLIMLVNGAIMKFVPDHGRETAYHRQVEFPVDFPELGFEADDSWYHASDRSVVGLYQREAGVKTGEDGKQEHLVLEYYENRIPAVIEKTRQEYDEPMRKGNVWEVSEEEVFRDGELLVTHYHYEMREEERPYLAEEVGTERDTYVISDRNRIFMIAYEDGAQREAEGMAAVELALERMQK